MRTAGSHECAPHESRGFGRQKHTRESRGFRLQAEVRPRRDNDELCSSESCWDVGTAADEFTFARRAWKGEWNPICAARLTVSTKSEHLFRSAAPRRRTHLAVLSLAGVPRGSEKNPGRITRREAVRDLQWRTSPHAGEPSAHGIRSRSTAL